jgi:hypothetical protein
MKNQKEQTTIDRAERERERLKFSPKLNKY